MNYLDDSDGVLVPLARGAKTYVDDLMRFFDGTEYPGAKPTGSQLLYYITQTDAKPLIEGLQESLHRIADWTSVEW